MEETSSGEIEVQETLRGGTRFILPQRRIGPLRTVGCLGIVIGIVFVCAGLATAITAILVLKNNFAAFASIPFALGGIPIIVMGAFALLGHVEIELSSEKIISKEVAGMFKWRRSVTLESIKRLTVIAFQTDAGASTGPQWLAGMAVLYAELKAGQKMKLAMGYPKELLHSLANMISSHIGLESQAEEQAESRPPVEVLEALPGAVPVRDRLEQPEGSKAVFQRHANGITVTFPPMGVFKGSKGLFSFGIIWLLFCVGIGSVMFLSGQGVPWPAYILISVFVLVGVLILIAGINMGFRQAVIAVIDGNLAILQKSPSGTKKEQWPREQIASIRMGPSGMEVNDVPVMELQVHFQDGDKFGILSERENEEIEWVATILRNELGMPAQDVSESGEE